MDTKKVIEKLVSIAHKQQQIINKLAQIPTPPMRLEPVKPQLHPGSVVLEHLPPAVKAAVKSIEPRGDTLDVHFQPGKASQQALNVITQTVQSLLKQNTLQTPYKVNPIV